MPNALVMIELLVQSEEAEETILDALRSNVWVRMCSLVPSLEQLHRYLCWLRDGLSLAEQLLGYESIPPRILFVSDPPMAGWGPHFFSLMCISGKVDAIIIGMARIACDASVEDECSLVAHEHAGIANRISAKANVVLMALEECFHCYQVRVLHRPLPASHDTTADKNDPLEIEWRAFRDMLICSGVIVCRSAHKA